MQVLADAFGVPRRDVTIVAGAHARLKRVTVAGIDDRDASAVLQSLGVDPGGLSDRTR